MDTPATDFVCAGSLEELKAKGRLVVHGPHRSGDKNASRELRERANCPIQRSRGRRLRRGGRRPRMLRLASG